MVVNSSTANYAMYWTCSLVFTIVLASKHWAANAKTKRVVQNALRKV